MTDEFKPLVGDRVVAYGVIISHNFNGIASHIAFDGDKGDTVILRHTALRPEPAPRTPAMVLREAACIVGDPSNYPHMSERLLREADRLEREAAPPPPDPVDVLRRFDEFHSTGWPRGPGMMPDDLSLKAVWTDARRAIAAAEERGK